MDKKTILENAILEQYLLGELSASEQLQVDQVLNSDTELKTYFEKLESDFETLAFENTITPPSLIKEKLLTSITSNTNSKTVSNKKSNGFQLYFKIAASIAAFLLLGSIWLASQLSELKNELKIVQEDNLKLNDNIENTNNNLAEVNKWYYIINSPDSEKYILKGNEKSPKTTVISYVNHKNKSVIINTERLPKLDNSKDYQMWADVDGEMIDMGIINKENKMLAMTYIENAESLNITIEPAGGNDHPTVSQLITNVYLK